MTRVMFSASQRAFSFSPRCAGFALALGLCLCNHAWSQGTGSQTTFTIKGFDVIGENPLDNGETSRILAPYLRTQATIETLQSATQALEQALRDKGYSLYRVSLPAQDLGQSVQLSIVRFTIGKVTVENPGAYSNDNIRASVPELRENQSPNVKIMAIQTALANENPGKQIAVVLKESDTPDKVDAQIKVSPSKPWNLFVSESNTGSSSTGRDRLTIAGTHSNLWNKDHQFTGAYTTSLANASDVRQYGFSYKVPLYRQGGMLGVSHTRSDVVGSFGAFTSTGAGHTFGLQYVQHLPAIGAYRDFLTFSLDDKLFSGSQINGTPISLDTRSRTLNVGYGGKSDSEKASWVYGVDWVGNLGGGRANDLFSYTNGASSTDVSKHRWHGLRFNGQYLRQLESKWTWHTRASAQTVNQALIAGEQFGLGGHSSVRGTAERATAGDKGYFLSTELTTPEYKSLIRFAAFLDWGHISNIRPNGVNKLASDRLGSVGLGLRTQTAQGFSLTMDYARLVRGSDVSVLNNPSAPQKGDDKLHVNASWRF